MKTQDELKFAKLYYNIYNLKGITPNERIILSILLSLESSTKKIFISDKGINKLTQGDISIQSSFRIIKKLKRLNIITTTTTANVKNVGDEFSYGGKTRIISINPDVHKILNGEEITIQPMVIESAEPIPAQPAQPEPQKQIEAPVEAPVEVISTADAITPSIEETAPEAIIIDSEPIKETESNKQKEEMKNNTNTTSFMDLFKGLRSKIGDDAGEAIFENDEELLNQLLEIENYTPYLINGKIRMETKDDGGNYIKGTDNKITAETFSTDLFTFTDKVETVKEVKVVPVIKLTPEEQNKEFQKSLNISMRYRNEDDIEAKKTGDGLPF
jgi:hypothetical protein